MLAKNPGFTAVAVLTLGLGIGANTAIFTVVNTVLLHPLPYPDADRMVNITRQDGGTDSLPMFSYWQQNNPGFEDLAAYDDGASSINLGGDQPELVQALKVSLNYFRLFGANPILGRTFTAEEDRWGGPRVLVMSYGLWQRRFGGDPAILGKTITLGGAPYMVIGALSPSFKPYPSTDVWIPLQADPNSTDQAGAHRDGFRAASTRYDAGGGQFVDGRNRQAVRSNASGAARKRPQAQGDPDRAADDRRRPAGVVDPARGSGAGAADRLC